MTEENIKICPYCNEVIDSTADVCPICCEALPIEAQKEKYHCPFCDEVIDPEVEICPICCEVLTPSNPQEKVEDNTTDTEKEDTNIKESETTIQDIEYRCPFCNEVIDNNSTFCEYCGESLSANKNSKDVRTEIKPSNAYDKQIDNYMEYMENLNDKTSNKWFFIIVGIIALMVVFITISFINNPTYKSIQKHANVNYYEYPTNAYDLITNINQQGIDLLDFLKANKSNHKKDMVFGTYFKNLEFYSWVLSNQMNAGQTYQLGVRISPKGKIIKPEIQPVYNVEIWDEQAEVALRINYNYLISTYSEYLGDEWNEILKIGKTNRELLENIMSEKMSHNKEIPNPKVLLKLIKESPNYKVTQQSTSGKEKKIGTPKSAATTQTVVKPKPSSDFSVPKPTNASTQAANHAPNNNLRNNENNNSTKKVYSPKGAFDMQWDEANKQEQSYNNSSNPSQSAIARDAVWMFINTEVGTNPNYGINKKRFSQAPMTKETIKEIYEYVKYRVNNYETTAQIIHADVDANLKAGKIFYNFYIKVTSSGEVIKLPVWTITVQPRFDL